MATDAANRVSYAADILPPFDFIDIVVLHFPAIQFSQVRFVTNLSDDGRSFDAVP